MIRHFGVLIPSTNTTVEMECRLLPPAYQAHIGRLMTSTPGQTFSPSRDEDIDYQSRLLGTAKVELVILAQTSASLFADDYDEGVTQAHERRRRGSGDHFGAGGRPGAARFAGASDRDRFALFRRGERARRALFRDQARARDRRARRLWRDQFLRDRAARSGERPRGFRPNKPARDRGLCRPRRQFPDDEPRSPPGSRSSTSLS